jgi:hypothetical protein
LLRAGWSTSLPGAQRAHRRHALHQPRIIADQFVEGHPESLGLVRLVDIRLRVQRARSLAAGGQHGQAMFGIQRIVAGRQAMSVAGVFAGARIGGADQRQDRRRHQHGRPCQVLLADVAEFMADVEIQRVGIVGQAVDHVRIQHQEIASEEAGGEGIQHAAHLHQVGLRFFLHVQLAAAGLDLLLEVGELLGGDQDAVALDVGNQSRLRETVEQEAEQYIDEQRADGADQQQRPCQQRQDQHQGEQPLFVLVDQIHPHSRFVMKK